MFRHNMTAWSRVTVCVLSLAGLVACVAESAPGGTPSPADNIGVDNVVKPGLPAPFIDCNNEDNCANCCKASYGQSAGGTLSPPKPPQLQTCTCDPVYTPRPS